MEDIHTCWFCDSECDCDVNYDDSDGFSAQVYCDECGTTGPLLEGFESEDDAVYCAIEKWNNPLIEI